jgi:adenosylcobinamide-phosphate synthase
MVTPLDVLLMLPIALAIDLALGEPPRAIHPVVWMGKVASFWERNGFRHSPRIQFIRGLGLVLIIIGLFAVPGYFILFYLKSLNFVAYVIVGALLLKYTFSLRELRQAALRVKNLLSEDKLGEARFELRSLVGRDTRGLPRPLLVSSAVESVAESASDSFVAPLFYFLLLGVPGAIAYRAVNTLDAMIGYHGKYEYLGKFASKLDDVLNFIPARLTALLIVLAAFLTGKNTAASRQAMLGDHSKTESVNAGWPMAAVAGALNVQLEKVGHYKLGRANAPLVPDTIDYALKLVLVATLLWMNICLIVGGVRFVIAT